MSCVCTKILQLGLTMSKKKILAGISFSWFRFVLSFVITIIQTPLIFKYLDKQEVGIWYLFFSLSIFMQMADFGLPAAVSRAVAYVKERKSVNDQPEVNFYIKFSVSDIYKSSFISFILLSSFVVIIGTILIYTYKPNFGVSSNLSDDVTTAFLIYLIGVFFKMTSNIPDACLSGLGDVGYDNLFRIIVQSLGLILIIIFLPIYSSIIFLSIIFLIQGIISTVVVHLFLKIKHHHIFVSKGVINYNLIKRLYSESIYIFINQIGAFLTNQSGIWIATYTLGAEAIADYGVTVQLILYGLSIAMSIPSAVNPYAAAAFSAHGVKSVHNYFFFTLKLSTFLVGLWIILLSIWGKSILNLWIGENHFLGYGVLIPLLINLFFELQHSINGGFVWNTGRWPFVPTTIAAGILNVILCFIGCYYYGLKGLAIGTMMAKLFTLNWYVVFYALRRLKISIKQYLNEYLAPSIIIILSLILLLYYFNLQVLKIQINFIVRGQPGIIIISLIIGGLVSFISFGILYYSFGVKKTEKQILINLLKNRSKIIP